MCKRILTQDELMHLEIIKDDILEKLEDAFRMVRGTSEENAAKSLWYAHIRMALDDEHDFLGRGGRTLQDTLEALEVEAAEEAMAEDNERQVGSPIDRRLG